ncbi:MAG: trans-2-enoyl-CoA reductase family protein [Calditrichaeota bacterium]|nr:MAG: trans-2-enoyl-CoA reductase family protein [Calditrichota bacterium]MBL1205951.1 trans-2-enoyl-CoA reductase family protein [Calditrichota bacterium]NOG45779.1 trans-2-enoyl-CoA reductase family protein [Calditrichota bacterium]
MVIKPRIRGFVCLTAHPVGCEAHVKEQINHVTSNGPIKNGPKNVLVIGASTGYGLSSRITAAFGSGASTLGVFFEKEPKDKKTATAGWYNSVAFEKLAKEKGLKSVSVNGDAFSDEIKDKVVDISKNEFEPFDLVVYSIASPRRTHPKTGKVYSSVLKPIDKAYDGRTLNTDKVEIQDVHLEAATDEEIEGTVAVMGGQDWEMWMERLKDEGLLAEGCQTVSYTYIGTELTWAIYWEGAIGKAKDDLDKTSARLNKWLEPMGGKSYVSVMKALVTQASSAIPVVPLYISVLYKIMKAKGNHEGCIEQIDRMYRDRLYSGNPQVDKDGRLRLDDWEMEDDVQAKVNEVWPQVKTENINELTDFAGYKEEFLRLFGFGFDGVDYDEDVNPNVKF